MVLGFLAQEQQTRWKLAHRPRAAGAHDRRLLLPADPPPAQPPAGAAGARRLARGRRRRDDQWRHLRHDRRDRRRRGHRHRRDRPGHADPDAPPGDLPALRRGRRSRTTTATRRPTRGSTESRERRTGTGRGSVGAGRTGQPDRRHHPRVRPAGRGALLVHLGRRPGDGGPRLHRARVPPREPHGPDRVQRPHQGRVRHAHGEPRLRRRLPARRREHDQPLRARADGRGPRLPGAARPRAGGRPGADRRRRSRTTRRTTATPCRPCRPRSSWPTSPTCIAAGSASPGRSSSTSTTA